jgi:hypothetical protein
VPNDDDDDDDDDGVDDDDDDDDDDDLWFTQVCLPVFVNVRFFKQAWSYTIHNP